MTVTRVQYGVPILRAATHDDVPGLRRLIDESVRVLSHGFYSHEQIESGFRFVFGPDTQLIDDRTYFVIEVDGTLAAAGGWSRRRTLYGGDQAKSEPENLLDPATESARIRAFFAHPVFARRGHGRALFVRCVIERSAPTLPDGIALPIVRMWRAIGAGA